MGLDHIPVSPEKQHQYSNNNAQSQSQQLSFTHEDMTSQDPSFQHTMDSQQLQLQQEYDQQLFQQQQRQFEQAQLWHQQQQHQQQQQDSYPGFDDPANQQQDQSVLSHAHLKPGHKATLLSYAQTLELYRQNAKKTNDPELQFEFAAFMIDAGKPLEDPQTRAELFDEAMKLLRKLATNGHAESQHYLAECFASGFARGKPDFDKAFPLWVQASKHGHPDAAYRTARCYDEGLGTRKDNARAVQFYR